MYQAKTALHFATFNAARHAAVRSGTFDAAREGLIKGMIPFYTTSPEPNAVWQAEQEVIEHWDDEELFCINRINPTDAAFLDFGDPILTTTCFIGNQRLALRASTFKMQICLKSRLFIVTRSSVCGIVSRLCKISLPMISIRPVDSFAATSELVITDQPSRLQHQVWCACSPR